MSAFDYGEKSVKKYETSLSGLNKKLEVQKVAVAEAKKEYEEMVKEHGRGSKEAEKAAREYNNQAASLNNLERYIERTKDELAKFEREQRIANSAWTKMGDKLESYGGKLQGIGSKMSDVGSSMTKKITLPAIGVVTAIGGIVSAFGWGRLVSLDNAQAKLKGLGYTAKDVERITLDVKEAVTGTTMTMAEGTDVAAGGLAAGVKEGKELEKYIRRVGNAAVGANRPIEDMAMIFNRVQGAGKLMTNELNSIEQGMPGFSKAMSKHLGVSTEKLREMVTDGKVSSKDFMKVMDSFAGDMAKEYAKTWDGMVSNTKANIGIIGESFLKGVFQDSKKSLADFIELLKSPEIKRRAEEMGEVARKSFTKMKDSIVNVVNWYKDLDDGQKTMIKRLGLVAVAGGPVLQVVGKLTSGFGSVLKVIGKTSKAIGVARGTGLVAGLTSLSPAAVPALAVAGLATVAGGVYALYKKQKDLKEVNLDLAESLSDQATGLENSADTFDKLSSKAEISNDELARLDDLNKRISDSSNPGEIKELQKQYDKLAEKSGLSKDELKKLFKANDDIIEQSHDVEKSISDQGNEFVESTDAVRGQVQALRDLSEAQVKGERAKLLEQETKARETIAEKTREQEKIEERLLFLGENSNLSQDELNEKIAETEEKLKGVNRHSDEGRELDQEHTDLINIKKERIGKTVDDLNDQNDKLQESIDKEQKKLDKLDATEQKMIDIKLANAGINEEGDKGLEQLDKSIAKNDEELAKLDEQLEKNGELTEKQQDKYDKLTETNKQQKETRDLLFEEYDAYNDINTLVDSKLSLAEEHTQKNVEALAVMSDIDIKEGNIVKQIQDKNKKHDESIKKLEKQKEEEGANKDEIDKQISSLEKKKSKNDANIEAILRELGIWDQVKDTIDLGTTKEKEKGNAVDGTKDKLNSQGDQIDSNNKKTDAGTKKEKARTKEAGKGVNKKVAVMSVGMARLNREATQKKTKKIGVAATGLAEMNRQVSAPVNKRVNLSVVGGAAIGIARAYAKGTPTGGHPGGHAILGDGGGAELATLPSGQQFLSASTATLYPNLPKGTHVMPHRETKKIMKSIPQYASGTDGWLNTLGNSEFARLLMSNSRNKPSAPINTSNNNEFKELPEFQV